jgi:hypothetical protein
VDGIDTYGRVMLGYNASSIDVDNSALEDLFPTYGGLLYGFFIGGRYHFTDHLGDFAEVGYGISWIQLGLTYKL